MQEATTNQSEMNNNKYPIGFYYYEDDNETNIEKLNTFIRDIKNWEKIEHIIIEISRIGGDEEEENKIPELEDDGNNNMISESSSPIRGYDNDKEYNRIVENKIKKLKYNKICYSYSKNNTKLKIRLQLNKLNNINILYERFYEAVSLESLVFIGKYDKILRREAKYFTVEQYEILGNYIKSNPINLKGLRLMFLYPNIIIDNKDYYLDFLNSFQYNTNIEWIEVPIPHFLRRKSDYSGFLMNSSLKNINFYFHVLYLSVKEQKNVKKMMEDVFFKLLTSVKLWMFNENDISITSSSGGDGNSALCTYYLDFLLENTYSFKTNLIRFEENNRFYLNYLNECQSKKYRSNIEYNVLFKNALNSSTVNIEELNNSSTMFCDTNNVNLSNMCNLSNYITDSLVNFNITIYNYYGYIFHEYQDEFNEIHNHICEFNSNLLDQTNIDPREMLLKRLY